MLRTYLPALVFLGLGTIVGLAFAYPQPPRRREGPAAIKATGDPYECGLPSEVKKGFRFGISFYLIAMLFILFDIEVIFLYPVAVQLREFGTFAMVEIDRLHHAAGGRLRLRLAARCARMEVIRHGAGRAPPDAPDDFRARQLRARDMLRGDLEGAELEKYVEERILTTTLDKAVKLGARQRDLPADVRPRLLRDRDDDRSSPARMDIARFGFEAFRASPRQADMIILSGRVRIKMAPIIRRIYDQMLEPKYAIAMGACSSSMGVFNNYAIVPADKFMPVDVHVPGCPPRPEALVHGILKLRSDDPGRPERSAGASATARVGTEEIVRRGQRRERRRRDVTRA